MVNWLVIGETQTGKTTFAREKIIKKYKRAIIYDVQNQWNEYPYFKKGIKNDIFRVSPYDVSFKDFIKLTETAKNTLFVFEEATSFFTAGLPPEQLIKALVGKAHTGNRYLFIFHSFRQVPPRIFDFCDWLIQFKTSEADGEHVNKKFPKGLEPWEELQSAPRFSKKVHAVSNLAKEGKI